MTTKAGPKYAYAPHPVFRLPPLDTSIWRYTPLEKLLSLVEKQQLHLCRASGFDDAFEGSVTARSEADLVDLENLIRASPEHRAHLRAERANARDEVVVSCWHKATHETEGMWARYGKSDECVAIRSTISRLIASLPQQRDPTCNDLLSTHVGEVEYIDFASDTFHFSNTFDPYVYKRREFYQEQEVRVVATITADAASDSAAGRATDFAVIKSGLLVPINVNTLIEAVIVSPKASATFEGVVRGHLDRFGLRSIPVMKSSMTAAPIY